MALGTLNITNNVNFVDQFNNSAGGAGDDSEVLYVDVLHLFEGATMTLSKLTIYVGMEFIYEDGVNNQRYAMGQGEVIDQAFAASHNMVNLHLDSGGQIVFVPEPSTGMLLGLGLVLLAGSRRRKKQLGYCIE